MCVARMHQHKKTTSITNVNTRVHGLQLEKNMQKQSFTYIRTYKPTNIQMLRVALTGLNEHGGEGEHHDEYHPVEFFDFIPDCCGKTISVVL
jgi:hypothetical protein